MTSRKNPGVAFWATAIVVCLPLLYVLSFGPACWWVAKDSDGQSYLWSVLGSDPEPHAPRVYWPIGWAAENGPKPVYHLICWYAAAFSRGTVFVPSDSGCNSWLRM